MPLAILFPGQNSRYPEMLEKLVALDAANREILERASDSLGRDLQTHFRAANPGIFTHNRDVQVGVFLASHMHWQMLERGGVRAEFSAGLSLGEYNHLVHIGALSFEDALAILEVRGEAYERAPRGMMAAVHPLPAEEVEAAVARLDQPEKLAVAMYNTPQQCVLSGEREAVESAVRELEEESYAQPAVVDDRLPMHSPLFRCVGEALRPALEAARWRSPRHPYLPNVHGALLPQPTTADFVEALAAHPWRPVRWRQSMEALAAAAADIVMVEAGPKAVLAGMFSKRWLNPARYSTDSREDFPAGLEKIIKELGRGPTRAASAD